MTELQLVVIVMLSGGFFGLLLLLTYKVDNLRRMLREHSARTDKLERTVRDTIDELFHAALYMRKSGQVLLPIENVVKAVERLALKKAKTAPVVPAKQPHETTRPGIVEILNDIYGKTGVSGAPDKKSQEVFDDTTDEVFNNGDT